MTPKDIKELLEHVDDTRELVLSPASGCDAQASTELFAVWCAARAEANEAFAAWRRRPGREAYAVYRAAEDRADAAEEALVAGSRQPALAAAEA